MAPVPNPTASADTGLPDSAWVSEVRDGLRDYPKSTPDTWTADGTNGVNAPGAVPISLSKPPIYGSATANTPLVRDNTAAQNYTVIDSGTPTGFQVLVNYDTGELTFATAPTSTHAMQFQYQTVKWRDASIVSALYAGLRAMFPTVGKTNVDTSVQIQTNQWDYTLPIWMQDPHSRIVKVEVADPFIPTEPFRPLDNWERAGLTQIHLPQAQRYSPVARLRITGWGPYLTLGDLEPKLFQLPIWYALGTLLPKQEAKRIREDTMVPLTQSGGQQPGLNVQTGDYYARRFEIELDRLKRVMGPGYAVGIRSVYSRNTHW